MAKTLQHIAMIMDGNGRWARAKGQPRIFGHREGARTILKVARACNEQGIKYLTLYAFSTENWGRPQSEVEFLVRRLPEIIYRDFKETLMKENMRLRISGRMEGLPEETASMFRDMTEASAENTGVQVILAFNYGGKAEIVDAVRSLCQEGCTEVDESAIRARLYLPDVPDIDLLIRTGGEKRLSNFMLWQAAYAELYFLDKFWPEFNVEDMNRAVGYFEGRNRRFGKVKS